MLVLSRKVGERIHIGNDVYVEVRKVAGNRVTLALCAPEHVRILRGELFDAAKDFDVLDEPISDGTSVTDTVVMEEPTPVASKAESRSRLLGRTSC